MPYACTQAGMAVDSATGVSGVGVTGRPHEMTRFPDAPVRIVAHRSLARYSGHLIWAMIRPGGVRYSCTEAAGDSGSPDQSALLALSGTCP